MTRDEVLEEVGTLATLEHFFIVECLSVQCALGHDLDAAEGGASDPRGRAAADGLAIYAQNALMHRFRRLNDALVEGGVDASLGRADRVSSSSHAEIPLEPPSDADLQRLVQHEHEIAMRIDERYTTLAASLGAVTDFPQLFRDMLQELLEDGSDHVKKVNGLRDALGDAVVADLLRATRRPAADAFEQRLLDLSDRSYSVVIQVLRGQFVPDVFPNQTLAVSAMFALDDVNRLLVQRGLLPPFSPL
jgi:hypothetical protein